MDVTKIYNRRENKNVRRNLRGSLVDAERILWSKLKSRAVAGLKFRRQFGFDNYVVDFYCPDLKLAIEIDGNSHFIGDAAQLDAIRQKKIESYGVRFLRFTNNDIYHNLNGVLQTIYRCVLEMDEKREPERKSKINAHKFKFQR